MMNPNDCNVADSDSNDVLSATVLTNGVTLNGHGDDSGNEIYGAVGHDNSGVCMTGGNGGLMLSDDEELPHVLREQDRFLPIANVAKLMKKPFQSVAKLPKTPKSVCKSL